MNNTVKKIHRALKDEHITMHAASGEKPGEIELLWQPVNDARSYVVQINHFTNSILTWKHSDIVTRTRYTATGLRSNKLYSFRVAAVTSKGQQGWSKPVKQKAS